MKRNKMTKRIVFFAVSLAVSIIVSHSALYAHGILSKEMETGKIAFSYDNGRPLAKGFVKVYDKEGKEIATDKTDANGVFDYSNYENVGKISAADPLGHRQTHVIDGSGQDHTTDHQEHTHDHHHPWENTPVVIAVVVVLLAIAAVFYLRNRKKIEVLSK